MVPTTQHVVYKAVDRNIHELWWNSNTGWQEGTLAAQTSNAPKAEGRPVGYSLDDASQHVFYRGEDKRVHELYWSVATGWREGALAAQTSNAPKTDSDPAAYTFTGSQHVVYRAVDGHIHELWWNSNTGWQEGTLAVKTANAPTAAAGPAGYIL